jgi:AcrR family transcriptional regulator
VAARRTQADRSAATQRALVDAATALLIERGWAATTAVAVCERAGCTRGALVHHYPSLSALLADALERLYEDLTHGLGSRPTTASAAIEAVWRAVGDPRFKAVFEAWSAAGNDPELAQELAPAIGRFAKLVAPVATDPDARAFHLTAREAMLGLALGRANNGGRPLGHERVVLARLRAEAGAIDERHGGEA